MTPHRDAEQAHAAQIQDQFTRQAEPFAAVVAPMVGDFLKVLVNAARIVPDDDALDVACGPGVLTCAVATRVAHITGIDVVPAMLVKARDVQKETGVGNVRWQEGSAEHLPFEDASFSLVVTRYSFHHMLNPVLALREMTRVCRSGGRVVVADATPLQDKADAFNAYERLRDPSHTRALPLKELQQLAGGLSLTLVGTVACDHDIELETLMQRSFPLPENAERVRRMAYEDLETNRLGLNAYRRNGEVRIQFPTTLTVWTRHSD